MIKLKPLTKIWCEQVRQWRNEVPESLRTPYFLTKEMQEKFYDEVVCNPASPHRYWAITADDKLIGCGGITNIQWENRIGEISLILDPSARGKGYGRESVKAILHKAFLELNLKTVCGECYLCNPASGFWNEIVKDFGGYSMILPNRKYWNGVYCDSRYFSIDETSLHKTRS